MTTYDVQATREGRWWIIRVPEIDGVTQALEYEDVATAARELIAASLDVPLSAVAVKVSSRPSDRTR